MDKITTDACSDLCNFNIGSFTKKLKKNPNIKDLDYFIIVGLVVSSELIEDENLALYLEHLAYVYILMNPKHIKIVTEVLISRSNKLKHIEDPANFSKSLFTKNNTFFAKRLLSNIDKFNKNNKPSEEITKCYEIDLIKEYSLNL